MRAACNEDFSRAEPAVVVARHRHAVCPGGEGREQVAPGKSGQVTALGEEIARFADRTDHILGECARDCGFEVIRPLEKALSDGEDPIQGMVTGSLGQMKQAEATLKNSKWHPHCECVRTEYPARDLSILDLLPPGVSKGWALERLAARLGIDRRETMAIGDNWNDLEMLEWAGQAVLMGNAAHELKTLAKLRGWKQAPPNDQDGVAVILEAEVARLTSSRP